jgi:hypothetical protein
MAFVAGVVAFAMSSSTPATPSLPVAPVPPGVAPAAARLAPKHVVNQHKGTHAIHRIPTPTPEPDDALAMEPVNAVLD